MSHQNTVDEQVALELFAKQASAEGIDLEELDDEQVEAAFGHFVENILPELFAEEGEHVEEEEPGVEDKIAAAQNAIAFDAFMKAASAEGVDLNELDEDDVAELFGAWLVQDVPALFEEQAKEAELLEYAKIAEANLSEMTVMGQHLGEVAADAFLAKIAEATPKAPFMDSVKGRMVGLGMAGQRAGQAVRSHYGELGEALLDARTAPAGQRLQAAKRLGKASAPTAAAAGVAGLGAYGAYRGIKALKARKAQQAESSKSASAIDERVLEILAAHGLIEG